MRLATVLAAALLIFAQPSFANSQNANLAAGPHDIDIGDVRLHYVVAGHGPLVFVATPGWGSGSSYLQKGLAPLARHLTLLFIDMRGSGGSSRPADRARMSQTVMADDIDQLRAALGLDTIDLMGHSDGGTIAIEYAERHPEHLRKLALIDARVLGDREGDNIHSYLTLWADDPHYRAAVQEEIKAESNDGPVASDADFEKYLSTVLPLYVSDPVRFAPKLAASFAGTHLSSYAANAQDDAQQSTPRDQTKELGNIKAKTLIINGTVDWICPYQEAQLLHAQIPGSQLSLYANKGHVPWIEDPSRFFPEISAYFRD